jgi:hypothetical protein
MIQHPLGNGCALGRARFEFTMDVPVTNEVIEERIVKNAIPTVQRLLGRDANTSQQQQNNQQHVSLHDSHNVAQAGGLRLDREVARTGSI